MAIETTKMKEWNELVLKNWDYWQYYKEMIDYSLQKSANSPITKYLYPMFYQERLLKRLFVENMQILGDITKEEVLQFETITNRHYLYNLYNYYRKPEGGSMKIQSIALYANAILLGREIYISKRPVFMWFLIPTVFYLGSIAVIRRLDMLCFGVLVNLTQWTAEKRKAEVWVSQELIKVPRLKDYPLYSNQIMKIIIDEKLDH
jgi:hypothetical protein